MKNLTVFGAQNWYRGWMLMTKRSFTSPMHNSHHINISSKHPVLHSGLHDFKKLALIERFAPLRGLLRPQG